MICRLIRFAHTSVLYITLRAGLWLRSRLGGRDFMCQRRPNVGRHSVQLRAAHMPLRGTDAATLRKLSNVTGSACCDAVCWPHLAHSVAFTLQSISFHSARPHWNPLSFCPSFA